jgi:hypothetical protein
MAVSKKLEWARLEDLYLDPQNPRLGRHNAGPETPQARVLELMAHWKLDELAVSFLESGGFWSHEAMIVIHQSLYGKQRLVVVEGNRRLAALINLRDAVEKKPADENWRTIARGAKIPVGLFTKIPYFLADNRDDIEGFLGFRHVTGIEEWRPAEKAEYITRLVDKGMDYSAVMRKIGSRSHTVHHNYFAYRLLLQIEKTTDIPSASFEDRFSVMYLSLRTEGVRKYLNINISADPSLVRREIPKIHKKALANFALWLFGDAKRPPLFTDSRLVDKFGTILESEEGRQYLERSESPNFDVALRAAGGDEPELVKLVERAADNVELTLTRAHHYRTSKKLRAAVERLAEDTHQLVGLFPGIEEKLSRGAH